MLFRKPPAARRMETLLSVAVAVQLVVGPLIGALLTGKPFWIALSIFGAGWAFFFICYLTGPDNIYLDGERHIYEWTTGCPWKPVTRSGSFADIKGVCISPRNKVIILMVNRKRMSKGVTISDPYLSSAGSSALFVDSSYVAAAHTLAEELNRVYGFPIVPYPKT